MAKQAISTAFRWHYQLAARFGLPLINPQKSPCDARLLSRQQISDYLRRSYVPWRIVDKSLVIATSNPSNRLKTYLQRRFEVPITLVYMTQRDIRTSLEHQFGATLLEQCLMQIRQKMPHYSASYSTTHAQRLCITGLLSLMLVLLTLAPQLFLLAALVFMNLLYLLTLGFKWRLLQAGHTHITCPPSNLPLPLDDALPIYTILVPMYHEEAAVGRLLNAMRALDYPKDKLDIKLVIEADDATTWQAIQDARPESYFDIIRVPACQPRTKPKACSYALHFARGEFITIYDAEDQPEPNQLKKAVTAFRSLPQTVVCLQARLNYFNWQENLLTRCFSIEYASLFDITLPALQRLGIPIPLGGTSNHMRTDKLRELLDWDPYNVTEDADLGIRLAMKGYRTQLLNSVTLEEATMRFSPWLKQRSRWIKGYLQTWLVYMRRPLQSLRLLGLRGFLGFQLIIGLPCLIFLLSPFMWALSIAWLLGFVQIPAAQYLLYACLGIFAMGYGCHFIYARRCIKRWDWQKMGLTCLLYPFYWFCHSLAAFKAFWQLILRPHYWEKTQHAQSRYQSNDIAQAMLHLRPNL